MTAQQGGDPRHQFTDSKGLGDVVVGPEIQAPDHLGFFTQSRQHDHGYLEPVGTDPATNLMTRQTRQHEIQQHQIGPQSPRQFQPLVTIARRAHLIARALKIVAQAEEDRGVILDHQNEFRFHGNVRSHRSRRIHRR